MFFLVWGASIVPPQTKYGSCWCTKGDALPPVYRALWHTHAAISCRSSSSSSFLLSPPLHPHRVFLTSLPASIALHKPTPKGSPFPTGLDCLGMVMWATGMVLEVGMYQDSDGRAASPVRPPLCELSWAGWHRPSICTCNLTWDPHLKHSHAMPMTLCAGRSG